jgi:hypothetical protein
MSNTTCKGQALRSAIVATALLIAASEMSFAGGHTGGAFGGGSASQSGTQEIGNSNSRSSLDRDKGLDRAHDRMSQQGLVHSDSDDKHHGKNGGARDKK